MNVNLFRKTLKEISISWPSYAVGLALYVYLILSVWPTIHQRAAEFEKLFANYPKGLLQVFGGSATSITTPEGYITVEFFAFIWFIIVGAFVIAYGTGAIGKEIESGTIEILLSQPITRISSLITKSITLFAGTIGLVVLTTLSTYTFGKAFDLNLKPEGILALTVIGSLFFLAIASFSLFFSVLLGERGRAALISASILTTMYIITVLAGLADWPKKVNDISLFHYYDAQKLLTSGHVPFRSVLVYAGIIIVFYIGSILVFNRRDIAP